MNESLIKWLDENRLDYTIDENNFIIEGVGKFFVVEPKEGYTDYPVLFDQSFELILSKEERKQIENDEKVEYLAFKFGSRWYYCDDPEKPILKELRYLGKEKDAFEDAPPFLGVHGWYDLANGSRDYADWCKKAKFANYKTLGICEENTLAGTLQFQKACFKKEIKPIIGETITVRDAGGDEYFIKLFVESEVGWKNLLLINAEINVFLNGDTKQISFTTLCSYTEGLTCILSQDMELNKQRVRQYTKHFKNVYYQFDLTQWDSDEKDKNKLLNTQKYLKEFYPELKPILFSEAYYLDQPDARIRRDLNAMGKVSFKNQSKDQWFKTPNEIFEQISSLFKDNNFEEVVTTAWQGAQTIGEYDFKIDTGKLHLPLYEMKEEEKALYEDNEELFWALLTKALTEKVENHPEKSKKIDEYVSRIEIETGVILGAKLHDYFLITWDILNHSREQGWITGYGRGSAAGSVVAYLLGIVQTDPLEYGLLFERFLNEGRLYKKIKVEGFVVTDDNGEETECEEWPGDQIDAMFKVTPKTIEKKVTGSMPDIDNDVSTSHRDEIKEYIKSRYGFDRVASIGTYGTIKIKGGIQGLARRSGTDSSFARYATGAINDNKPTPMTWQELFQEAQKTTIYKGHSEDKPSFLKQFIQENTELIDKMPLVLGQPLTASMHAGGVIIVPLSENGIYDQMPVKLVDGVLVSEWDMHDVESAGFLKMDLLGLLQLDKIMSIIDLIKNTTGEQISLLDIPLDDEGVFDLFSKGVNEDVFQFGGFGLKGYTSSLKPETINDLIATVALYRPGPIETGAHNQYVNRKNGIDPVIYFRGTEKILEETYGLMCYQEQVMEIVSELAGFTKNEADEVRKAIGKKLPELMREQKQKFIDGGMRNGHLKDELTWLWDQIEVFATYSFNKSHAACYAITGYHCQWFKHHYPLQFWTTSLRYADDKSIPARLSEIYSSFPQIKLSAVDINKSELTYTCDTKLNTIYWTISSVKQVGEQAVVAILEERKKNGDFFGVVEFATRMKPFGRAVRKNTIINMIISGAFDEVENVKQVQERFATLEKYMNFINTPMDEEMLAMKKWKEYRWIIEQKKLSGIGVIDFKKMVAHTNLSGKVGKFIINKEIMETPADDLPEEILIAGLITKFDVRGTDAKPYIFVELTDGQTSLSGALWSETCIKYSDILKDGKTQIGRLLVMTAQVRFDERYKKVNTFFSTKKSLLTVAD